MKAQKRETSPGAHDAKLSVVMYIRNSAAYMMSSMGSRYIPLLRCGRSVSTVANLARLSPASTLRRPRSSLFVHAPFVACHYAKGAYRLDQGLPFGAGSGGWHDGG